MAEKIDFSSLQPEYFTGEPVWSDFLEALAETIQEKIRDPIGELEDIRHIIETTDPEVIRNTLINMGFDLPYDIIRHNSERLAKSVYMLALFHERSGTDDLAKAIGYVLGREVVVTNLYTNNYTDFYDKPHGPLLADGGDWYKTTHIRLGMEVIPNDAALALAPGQTLSDRLLEAYFEFAPINHVVEEFYQIVKAHVTLGITGRVFIDPTRRITIGLGIENVKSLKALVPKTTVSGQSYQLLADLRFVSSGCYDIGSPLFGLASFGVDSDAEIEQYLTVPKLNESQVLNITVPIGQYGYLAVPAEMGWVRFTEKTSGLTGGWDGAAWPEDEIGNTVGGMQVTRVIEGEEREWIVYRTDFPSLGNIEFDVTFQYSGKTNSCDNVVPDEGDPLPHVPVPDYPISGNCYTVAERLLPVYGVADIGLYSDQNITNLLPEESPTTESGVFTFTTGPGKYGYFAYPVELGLATFTDLALGIPGGWDGASWPSNGSIGSTSGPIIISRTIGDEPSDWYLYRTDFSNIGTVDFHIEFPMSGLAVTVPKTVCLDEDAADCVSGYPSAGVWVRGVANDTALTDAIDFIYDSTDNMAFALHVTTNRYGYFAYPAELGAAAFIDVNTGLEGGWDGATWPEDGSIGSSTGPRLVHRIVGGISYAWFVYRTDFSGLGDIEFEVHFANAGRCVNTSVAAPPTDVTSPAEGPVCVMAGMPRYVAAPTLDTSFQLLAMPNTFADTSNQFFSIGISGNDYGWFAYPAILGEAVFVEQTTYLVGGWDGASWPTDGSIGSTSGPTVMYIEQNGVISPWFIYRTDFKNIGLKTYEVIFGNPNIAPQTMGNCDVSGFPNHVNYPDVVPEDGCLVASAVRFGTSDVSLTNSSDVLSLVETADTNNVTLSWNLQGNEYGYIAYPAALGLATFVDTTSNFEGGWDGAAWADDGSIGATSGPVVIFVTVNSIPVPYFVYRTDFPGIGVHEYAISFENPGVAVGDTAPCNIDGYPRGSDLVPGQGTNTVAGTDCYVDEEPRFGAFSSVTSSADVDTLDSAPSTGTQVFTIDTGSDYGWFTYPAALGEATFVDPILGLAGGWDGATWPTDGSIGTGSGPIVVVHEYGNGNTTEWFAYRTDFPGVGVITFEVSFENALNVGDSIACDTSAFPGGGTGGGNNQQPSSGDCLVADYPSMGVGTVVESQSDVSSFVSVGSTSPQTLTLNVPTGQFGFFISPAALGPVTFTDTSIGLEGGWDGAGWHENGTIGNTTGPVKIIQNIGGETSVWLVYRTDFSGLGNIEFDVSYAQSGLQVGDFAACNTQGVPFAGTTNPPDGVPTVITPLNIIPVYGEGPAGIDTDQEISFFLHNALPNAQTQTFTVDVPLGEYGYFAHRALLGRATFTNTVSGLEGGWNGATWPTDGSIGLDTRPLVVLRSVNGEIQTWYVYRTDFPGIGQHEFEVSFGSPVVLGSGQERLVRVTLPQWSTDRPDIVHISDTGFVTFGAVNVDTVVRITTTFEGFSDTVYVTVKATLAPLATISIVGPDVVSGGTNVTYYVEGLYNDGHYRNVSNADLTVLSPYAYMNAFGLFAENPPQDEIIYLRASVLDNGVEHIAVKEVNVTHTQVTLHVSSMEILGDDELEEGASTVYAAIVTYSDGNIRQELVLWESSSSGVYIDQSGVATAINPDGAFNTTITAAFQFNGVKNVATKNVNVTLLEYIPVALHVQGPSSIVELSTYQYSAFIEYSNGQFSQVTPTWYSSKFSVDTLGRLNAGSVGGALSIVVGARYQGYAAEMIVAVYDTPIKLEHIIITGPDNAHETDGAGNSIIAQYRAYAQYSNGITQPITPMWSVSGNPSFTNITSAGEFSFSNPTEGLIELVAVYDDGGFLHQQSKQVVLIPRVFRIAALSIIGPSEVLEGQRAALSATAIYSDGTTETVTPRWSLRSVDPVNLPEIPADIVSPGIIQGRSVEEDTPVIAVAQYFQEVAEYPMIVRNYDRPGPDVPLSHRIVGPTTVAASRFGSYSLMCQFDNTCAQEIALSNDWSLLDLMGEPLDQSIAAIDSEGFLRSINGQSIDVIVVATWEFAGHAIREEYPVSIVSDEIDLPELLVGGPSAVRENSLTQYTVELFHAGDVIVPGEGDVPPPQTISWDLEFSVPNVAISNSGMLSVGNVVSGTSITIIATYTYGGISVSKTRQVLVTQQLPLYGKGPAGINSSQDIIDNLTETVTIQSGGSNISLTLGTLEYGYFAIPVVNGSVLFRDPASGLEGGWDGASWPLDGSIGTGSGPIVVSVQDGSFNIDYYLYRTDFAGLGNVTVTVQHT